ncbi:MAG: hypothetical protein LUH20_02050, partial [Lachnospiraceae bacterium]|nr:hypothetical protein [Lachnospiraceae bacterium]
MKPFISAGKRDSFNVLLKDIASWYKFQLLAACRSAAAAGKGCHVFFSLPETDRMAKLCVFSEVR